MFNIFEISRMATHNGPGYRTTVHFMGCPLRCRWCSTPESQSHSGLGYNPIRCIGCSACGDCISICPEHAISAGPDRKPVIDRDNCTECFRCAEVCCAKAIWKYGRMMDFDSLLKEIIKDMPFFKNSGGGITFSGGECLLHANEELASLFAAVKSMGISIGVDTCGHVPRSNIDQILPYVDFFLWDIKKMDPDAHKQLTGADNSLILENLEYVCGNSSADIYIRIPLIPGLTDSDEDIISICNYLKTLTRIKEIDLLPFHTMGKNRYSFCGKKYLMGNAERQTNERLNEILNIVYSFGIPVKIIG